MVIGLDREGEKEKPERKNISQVHLARKFHDLRVSSQ